MAGLGAGRLGWGGSGGDGENDGKLGSGELRLRSIGIGKAVLEIGIWGLETRDNTGDMSADS